MGGKAACGREEVLWRAGLKSSVKESIQHHCGIPGDFLNWSQYGAPRVYSNIIIVAECNRYLFLNKVEL